MKDLLIMNVIRMKLRVEIFGFDDFGRMFWMIVKYMIIDNRIVVENLIFFFEFVGRRKMKFIRKVIKIKGSIKFII